MEFSRKFNVYKDGELVTQGTTKTIGEELGWTYKRVTYCIDKTLEGNSVKGYTIEQETLPADASKTSLNSYNDVKRLLKIQEKELTRAKREINMQDLQIKQIRLQLDKINQLIDELKGVNHETE